jgi:hypothetical protein
MLSPHSRSPSGVGGILYLQWLRCCDRRRHARAGPGGIGRLALEPVVDQQLFARRDIAQGEQGDDVALGSLRPPALDVGGEVVVHELDIAEHDQRRAVGVIFEPVAAQGTAGDGCHLLGGDAVTSVLARMLFLNRHRASHLANLQL